MSFVRLCAVAACIVLLPACIEQEAPVETGTSEGQIENGAAEATQSEVEVVVLDKTSIRATISHQNELVKACYESQLEGQSELNATIVYSWSINAEGRVEDLQIADVKGATGDTALLEGCVGAVLGEAVFPKPADGGIVKVKYPFAFKANAG